MEKVVCKCECCGEEFETPAHEYNRYLRGDKKHITCSRLCANRLNASRNKGENNINHKDKVKLICEFCGKEYFVSPSVAADSKFCCRSCKDDYRKERSNVIINCKYCGKELKITKYQHEHGKVYCSRQCSGKDKDSKVEKNCVVCNKTFKVHKNKADSAVACSTKCQGIWQSTVYTQSEEVQDRLKRQGTKTCLMQNNCGTLPERLVEEYFVKNNIEYASQYVIGGKLTADFYLPSYNCIFEVYGDYWHGNPNKYGDNLKPLNDMQKHNKHRDIRRYKVLTNKYNFNFYSMWEYNIINNLEDSMKRFHDYINTKIRNDSAS